MKIVINSCYGGFGLSYEAMMLYAKLKGFKLYAFVDKYDSQTYKNLGVVPYKPGDKKGFCIHYSKSSILTKDRHISNKDYFSCHMERTDPTLVEVVETLGDKANGDCAKLKIVEIPDGIEYEIDEYDGIEHVEEVHRKWY